MAIQWTSVQNAFQLWVSTTTTLPTIWENQRTPQPARPYASLRISSPPRKVGGLDAIIITTDPTQVGQEIQQTVRGQREIGVSVHVVSPVTTGAGTAMEFLTSAMTGLSLPSQVQQLFAAGISLVDFNPAIDLTQVDGATYVSHAVFDARFYIVDTAEESTGYISEVDITPTVDGTTYPVTKITGL